jgi:hypothetical protein
VTANIGIKHTKSCASDLSRRVGWPLQPSHPTISSTSLWLAPSPASRRPRCMVSRILFRSCDRTQNPSPSSPRLVLKSAEGTRLDSCCHHQPIVSMYKRPRAIRLCTATAPPTTGRPEVHGLVETGAQAVERQGPIGLFVVVLHLIPSGLRERPPSAGCVPQHST